MRPVKPLKYGNPEELPREKALRCAAARTRLFMSLDQEVFWQLNLPLVNTLYEYLDQSFLEELK